MAISEQEMAGLSDEERQALEAEADDDEVQAVSDQADDEDTVEEPVAAKAEAPADEAPQPAAEAEAEPEAEELPSEFAPRFEAKTVEDFDAKMQALETQEAELRKKLADGDVTIDEYDAEKSRIGKEVRQLERAQHEAEMYAKMNQQMSAQKWSWEQEQFFGQESSKIYEDKLLMAALDTAVKDLANDPKNSAKTGAWFLKEADRMVRERFQGAVQQAGGTKPVATGRTPDVSKLPKTLASIPTAELPDTGGDEFANLDKLSGIELEKKLARMSPEEVDRYLRVAA